MKFPKYHEPAGIVYITQSRGLIEKFKLRWSKEVWYIQKLSGGKFAYHGVLIKDHLIIGRKVAAFGRHLSSPSRHSWRLPGTDHL